MIYDFFLYTGPLNKTGKCPGAFVVKTLIRTLPKQLNVRLYFDNWFCTVATIRSDNLQGCNLPSETELRKLGRGVVLKQTAIQEFLSHFDTITNVSIFAGLMGILMMCMK